MNKRGKQIVLKTKKQVFGALSGNNISAFHGEGFEFSELREYAYGDDVRKIDWKTTARVGKPFIKVYNEERELNVVVSTMLSGSTFFGSDKIVQEYIIEVMSLLGFGAIRNRDQFSHILYADKLYRYSKPSKKIYAVTKEVDEAIGFNVIGKEANFDGWIDELNKRVLKKSLLIMIGDFVGEVNISLLAKKHDLVVIVVRDRFLENLKEMGEVTLVDPAHLSSFSGNIDSETIDAYREALVNNDKVLFKHLRRVGARFTKLYTNQDPYLELSKKMR